MMEYTKRDDKGRHSWTISGEGIIQGNWCHLKDKHKKSVKGKNFEIKDVLEELPSDYSLEEFYDDQYQYKVSKNY